MENLSPIQRANRIIDNFINRTPHATSLGLMGLELTNSDLLAISPRIRTIAQSRFEDETPLTVRLTDNLLTTIPSGAFAGMNLSALVLNHNHITSIEPGAFENTRLSTLSLTDNQITNITPDAFRGIALLGSIGLGQNPLSEESLVALQDPNFFGPSLNGQVSVVEAGIQNGFVPSIISRNRAPQSTTSPDSSARPSAQITPATLHNMAGSTDSQMALRHHEPIIPQSVRATLLHDPFAMAYAENFQLIAPQRQDSTPLNPIALLSSEARNNVKEIILEEETRELVARNIATLDQPFVPSKHTLKVFLQAISQTNYFKDRQTRECVVMPTLNYLFSGSIDQARDNFTKLVPLMGNCPLPIGDGIMQAYFGLKESMGEVPEPWIVEKCAVREMIVRELHDQLAAPLIGEFSDPAERAEKLVNQLFCPADILEQQTDFYTMGKQKCFISNRKNLSPSSSLSYFTVKQGEPIFLKFLELVCVMDKSGKPMKNSDGLFMRDDKKVDAIRRNFVRRLGIINKDVEKTVRRFQQTLSSADNPLSDILLHTDDKVAKKLMDDSKFRDLLEDKIFVSPNKSVKEICENGLQERLSQIRNFLGLDDPDLHQSQQRETETPLTGTIAQPVATSSQQLSSHNAADAEMLRQPSRSRSPVASAPRNRSPSPNGSDRPDDHGWRL